MTIKQITYYDHTLLIIMHQIHNLISQNIFEPRYKILILRKVYNS